MAVKKTLKTIGNVAKWLIGILLVSITLIIALTFYVLYNPPPPLIAFIKETVEKNVRTSAGLFLSIKEIEKLSISINSQKIVLKGIVLNENDSPNSNYFLKVEKVDIGFDALGFLFGKKDSILETTISAPKIQLILDKKGKLTFNPKLPPSKKEPEKPFKMPRLPDIKLCIQHSQIAFKDEHPLHPFYTVVDIPRIYTNLLNSQDLDFSLQALCKKLDLNLAGKLNILNGASDVKLSFKEDELERWAKYFIHTQEYALNKGKLAIKINAKFNDWKLNNLHFNTLIKLNDLTASINKFSTPVTLPGVDILISEKQTNIDGLNVNFGQPLLYLNGKIIYAFLPELIANIMKDTNRIKDAKFQQSLIAQALSDTRFNINLNVPALDLNTMIHSLPSNMTASMSNMSVHGIFNSSLHASGTPLKLAVDGFMKLNSANINGIPVNNFHTDLKFQNKQLIIPYIRVDIFGGRIKGNVNVNLASAVPAFNGKVSIIGISAENIINTLKVKVPSEYSPRTILNSNISFYGTPANPNAKGTLVAEKIRFPNSSKMPVILNSNMIFAYENQNAKVDFNCHSKDIGKVKFSASLIKNKTLKGNASILDIPLITLNKWVTDLTIKSGKTDINLDFNGPIPKNIKSLNALTANAKIFVKNVDASYPLKQEEPRTQQVIKAKTPILEPKVVKLNEPLNAYMYSSTYDIGTSRNSPVEISHNSNVTNMPEKQEKTPPCTLKLDEMVAQSQPLSQPIAVVKPLKKPQTQILSQKIDKLTLVAHLKNGVLEITPETSLKTGETELKLWGKVFPLRVEFNSKNKKDPVKFTGDLGEIFVYSKDINLKDFPLLKNWDVKDGHIYFNAHAQHKNNDWQAEVQTNVDNLSTKELIINNIRANAVFANKKLNVNEISISQHNDQILITGTVDVKPKEPVLDLNLAMRDFRLSTMFSFVPKEFFQKMEKETKEANTPPKDVKPVIYRLSQNNEEFIKSFESFDINTNFETDIKETLKNEDITKLTSQDMSINLPAKIQQWDRFKQPPLTAEEKPVMEDLPPFWEMIKGKVSSQIRLKGTAKDPQVDVIVTLIDGEIYKRIVNEMLLNASLKNQVFDLKKFHVIESSGGYFDALGTVDLNKQTLSLETTGNFNLNWANSWLKPFKTKLEGNTTLIVTVDGTFKDPHILASAEVLSGVSNDIYFDSMSALMEYIKGNLQITYANLSSGGKEVIVSGTVPIQDKSRPMDITVKMEDESFGLISLFNKDLEWLKGQGNALIKVTGLTEMPQLDGKIRLRDAKIYLNNMKEAADNINADISIDTNKVTIDKLDTLYSKGMVDVTGTVDLLKYLPSFLDLKVQVEHLNYSKSPVNAVVSTDLTIRNDMSNPSIGGKLTLEKGEVNLQLDSMKTGAIAGNALPIRFGGLKITISDDFWIRSPIFDMQPYGTIKLAGPQERVRIDGKLEIKKGGKIYLLNNQFKILSGIIEFKSAKIKGETDEKLNPNLEFIAEVALANPKKTENPVAKISGTMDDLMNQRLKFEWIKKGGLTETEIISTLGGAGLVSSTMQGGVSKALESFKDFFARGFLDPLTSGMTEALGLEELTLGFDESQNLMVGVKTKSVLGGFSGAFEGNFDNKGKIKYFLKVLYRPGTRWGLVYTYDAKKTYAHEVRAEVGYTLDEVFQILGITPKPEQ